MLGRRTIGSLVAAAALAGVAAPGATATTYAGGAFTPAAVRDPRAPTFAVTIAATGDRLAPAYYLAAFSLVGTVAALRANWWGLAGERLSTVFGRLSDSELVSGIPGSPTRDYGVPFSLTEEFSAVYRMHPLMPDRFDLRSHEDDRRYREEPYSLRELSGPGSLALLDTVPVADLLYSFGTEHPGLVTLHNFPRFLQEFIRPDGKVMDLAAVDILRHRELGVPRYCEFRRLLRLRAPASFEELTGDPDLARRR